MANVGFNIVRLGEGAWWYWEPEEGRYQFELFDRVIGLCKERNIKVIMGTPTYTGPAWIMHRYPEVLRVNHERVTMAHGSRQNLCYASPKYRELSRKITSALAAHYARESQVIAWQLDNEVNLGVDASYTEADRIAFREWLKAKYNSLDALNHAWGTKFWSQVYSDWEQVDLPAPTSQGPNPTRLLDHSRFVSDNSISFLAEQRDILKRANPAWKVTHNAFFGNINPPDLAAALDFYSFDQYPLFFKSWTEYVGRLIESRSMSFPFTIMEQQSGPGGQMSYLLRTPEPGEIRLWTYQSVVHGADKLLYFTWRTCPFGTEQHWHGLVDHDNKDNRRLIEAMQTGGEIKSLPEEFFNARPVRVAGVLRDFDVDVNEKRVNTYTHDGRWEFGRWTASLLKHHVNVDYVWTMDDFNGYSILFASHLKLIDDELLTKLRQYVEEGGTLVLGAQSGLHDRNLHILLQTPPGPLAELAGIEVEDWTTLDKGQTRSMSFVNGTNAQAISFVETLRMKDAGIIARWSAEGFLNGKAAASSRRVGRGRVIYLGAYLDSSGTDAVVDSMIADETISSSIDAPAEVECVVRRSEQSTFYCILNHSATTAQVSRLPTGVQTLVGPSCQQGMLRLGSFEVAILHKSDRSPG